MPLSPLYLNISYLLLPFYERIHHEDNKFGVMGNFMDVCSGDETDVVGGRGEGVGYEHFSYKEADSA